MRCQSAALAAIFTRSDFKLYVKSEKEATWPRGFLPRRETKKKFRSSNCRATDSRSNSFCYDRRSRSNSSTTCTKTLLLLVSRLVSWSLIICLQSKELRVGYCLAVVVVAAAFVPWASTSCYLHTALASKKAQVGMSGWELAYRSYIARNHNKKTRQSTVGRLERLATHLVGYPSY